MIRFRSLFWKIFLSVWLANMLIILITTSVVVYNWEQRRSSHSRDAMVQQLGDWLVPLLEKQASGDAGPLPEHFWKRSRGLRIETGDGTVLLNNRRPGHDAVKHTLYTDSSGKTYKIFLPDKPPPHFIRGPMQEFFRLQFFVIFLVSGCVSYLLTLLLTRPLKHLQHETRRIGKGDTTVDLDSKLLTRKDEIGDLAREYEQMLLQINSLIDSKQALLHDVSHELRAPLARMVAALGLLQQENALPNNDKLDRFEKECEEINGLIESILAISRLHSLQPQCENLSHRELCELLQGLADDVAFEFPEHDIQLQLDNLSDGCFADSKLLSTAVLNVLRNACIHTPSGSTCMLRIDSQDDSTIIQIIDNGPGIAARDVEKIFQPFYRENNSSATGFGLGLNIAKRALEKCGGTIRANLAQQGGLEIQLQLPAKAI